MSGFREKLDAIYVEDLFEREGFDFKLTHGSSGEQINVHTCPFCGGSEWKVFANRETGVGNCFHGSCGVTFNKQKLIAAFVGSDNFRTIAKYVDEIAGDLGVYASRSRPQIEVTSSDDWRLPENIELPTSDGQTLQYLADRGFGVDVAARHHLRYCHEGWYNFEKADGTSGGQNFSERVIIPVFDLDGNMVTFQGRDITGKAERKYLFPAGLPGTSAFLYNGHNVCGKSVVIMNEGVTDVWKTELTLERTEFERWGVIGSFGIKFSVGRDGRDQMSALIKLKKRGLKTVVVMWDGERKAFDRALEAAGVIMSCGLNAEIAMTPEGKDPGELTSAEALQAIRSRKLVKNKAILSMLKLTNPYKR